MLDAAVYLLVFVIITVSRTGKPEREKGRGWRLRNRSWGRSHLGPPVSHHLPICLHTPESQMAAEHFVTQRGRTQSSALNRISARTKSSLRTCYKAEIVFSVTQHSESNNNWSSSFCVSNKTWSLSKRYKTVVSEWALWIMTTLWFWLLFVCSTIIQKILWDVLQVSSLLYSCVFKAFYCFSIPLPCTWNRDVACEWTCCSVSFFLLLEFWATWAADKQYFTYISMTTKRTRSLRSCSSLCCYRDNKGALISSSCSSLCQEGAGWCNAVFAAPSDALWIKVARSQCNNTSAMILWGISVCIISRFTATMVILSLSTSTVSRIIPNIVIYLHLF